MKKLAIGVVGVGRIGKVHIKSLALGIPEAQVVAVTDPQTEEARRIAELYGIQSVKHNFGELVQDGSIEAVVICSPTDTHARYIVEAARAGKHIFCEKPVDLSLEVIRDALNEVEKQGVKLMVGFNRRFDPGFRKARVQVEDGKVGEPHLVKITSRDPGPPPPEYISVSGGIFLDMTIHDFDMARYIVGSEVVEVFAKGRVLIDKQIGELGDVDTALILLTFENGCLGVIDNSRKASYGYDQRLEIFGSAGMVQVDNCRRDTHELSDATGSHKAVLLDFFMDRYIEAYAEEMKVFVQAVAGEIEVPVSGEDGLRSVAIGLAAKKSVAENRPVKLAEILV
ncbi:MAG TPA: inositol 2-dehydrogenase [Acidobacteriota bacterium]|nr:inositol 2-dehydrogenase [Acidobacteriota bacterium]